MDQILDSHQVQDAAPVYAGFWTRFAAVLIDGIIIGIIQGILSVFAIGSAFVSSANDPNAFVSRFVKLYLIIFLIQWLYFALMESSAGQATLGKKAMGIKVTDEQGNRISFGRASGRFFSKFISSIIVCIGYLMMLWSDKKQCLHDKIAGTLVVRK